MKIYITGTPGTGKTTISLALKESLNSIDVFEIKQLLVKFNLLEEYDPTRDTTLFDDDKAVEEIQPYLEERNDYILVGPPLYFDKIAFDVIIVLTCSKKIILQDRLKTRGYKQAKIYENLEAELLGVILGECMDYFQEKCPILVLDSCDSSVEQLLEKIQENLQF